MKTKIGIRNSTQKAPTAQRRTRAKFYRFLSPTGAIYEVCGLRELCRDHDLNASHMSKVARGKVLYHKGWCQPYL